MRTFYPADPVGVVPGGVDSFIRGLIKWAPDDIEFSLVGMSTDAIARPVGRWSVCDLGRRQFRLLPVVHVADAGRRGLLPLSLRYCLGAMRHRQASRRDFDIFEFHRIEPALLYLGDPRPKNAFFHNDMDVIRSEHQADIRWRHWPAAYFALERRAMRSFASAWSVRAPATQTLRERYPFLAPHIHFTPTWVDPEVFRPPSDEERRLARIAVENRFVLSPDAFRLIFVGRLDDQKDPHLLLSALTHLTNMRRPAELLIVGDGMLRQGLELRVQASGLAQRVRFAGLCSPAEIARLFWGADCFVLTSAYEGMPMALLEALGCGVPAVTTPVGEVHRVMMNGLNGEVSADRSIEALTRALYLVAGNQADYSVAHCVKSVANFSPQRVLRPVYENYRRLGAPRLQSAADGESERRRLHGAARSPE